MGALRDGLGATVKNDLTIESNNKLYFRDTGLYIQSSEDGKLIISSDGTGNGTVELQGNVDVKATDKAGARGIRLLDSDDFPVHKLLSNGNQELKGLSKRTSVDNG